jgi:hypothetical protein
MNGQKVGLKFGWDAVKQFFIDCDENKEDYFDGDLLTGLGIASLVYFGYANNQKIKDEDVVFTMEDFEDCIVEKLESEEGAKEIEEILKVYDESKQVKLFIRQANKVTEEIKKKTLERI